MLSLKLLNKEKEKKKQFVEETPSREAYVKYAKDLVGLDRWLGRAK